MGRTGRALAGLATVTVLGLICALAVTLFRGDWAETVPVTVISDRAGLVMNPDAKVKIRGVQVGQVSSIESLPNGDAALHLSMNKSDMHLIPSDVAVDIASSTVFGAKFVNLDAPPGVVTDTLQPGQTIQSKHVTVEINTVFQQLVGLLDKIDPAKLNETLGAVATAFDGRGEQFGQALVDFDSLLAKLEPSLPNLSHDIEAAVPTLNAYGDATPDLVSIIQEHDDGEQHPRRSAEEPRRVPAQHDRVGEHRQRGHRRQPKGTRRHPARSVAHHPLAERVPRNGDLRHRQVSSPSSKGVPQYPGILVSSGLTLGVERYRYPKDLPKVAASTGGRPLCKELGLPEVPPGFRTPFVAADVGNDPTGYGNQGILLNSDGLKQWLYGPIDGPPRNSAQIGMPG